MAAASHAASVAVTERMAEFLQANNVSADDYKRRAAALIPRYVRTALDSPLTLAEIQHAFNQRHATATVNETVLPHFYQLCDQATNTKVSLTGSQLYQSHQLHGMDLASALVVYALNPQSSDHVLDLCVAPGNKLALMVDLMQHQQRSKSDETQPEGGVTGVDVSFQRLVNCYSLLRKYQTPTERYRLYLADGCEFSLPPPSGTSNAHTKQQCCGQLVNALSAQATQLLSRDQRRALKRFVQQATRHTRHADYKRQKLAAPEQPTVEAPEATGETLYDRVLIDAECTHDGSTKHTLKYQATGASDEWNSAAFDKRVLDQDRLSGLSTLQRSLLHQGWRMLRPGGTLVYSTCSLFRAQNEAVIEWLLEQYSDQIDLVDPYDDTPSVYCKQTNEHDVTAITNSSTNVAVNARRLSIRSPDGNAVEGALQLDPLLSNTGGMFICKLKKR